MNVSHKKAKEFDGKKAQSAMMTKSRSSPEINPRSTQLQSKSSNAPQKFNSKERKVLARVYWRDGTYHTVPVAPGITAKEVCEAATKKTKVAIFENLFRLYECFADGTENILLHATNVYDLLMAWGEDSENHLVCDLGIDAKNTVKSQLRKTMAADRRATAALRPRGTPDRDTIDLDAEDFDFDAELARLDRFGEEENKFDSDDELEDSEENKSIEKMIQEMIKLKRQLQEEDEQIEQLSREEQQVDLLISRLANL